MTSSNSTWMSEIFDQISGKPLGKLCVPGAHDAGMSVLNETTSTFVQDCNTKTQTLGFNDMLANGVRYFDLRPTFYDDRMWLGHFSDVDVLGWEGGTGLDWNQALAEIESFVSAEENKQELVILSFSHYLAQQPNTPQDVLIMQGFTNEQIDGMIGDVLSSLGDYMYQNSDPAVDLGGLTLETILGGGKNVICMFEEIGKRVNPATGVFARTVSVKGTPVGNLAIWNEYADSDDEGTMVAYEQQQYQEYLTGTQNLSPNELFLLSWTMTWTGPASNCISDMAASANSNLADSLAAWRNNGLITDDQYPNILYLDYFDPSYGIVDQCKKLMGVS